MADETKPLLQTLTESRMGVPARRDERITEPSEPIESGREDQRGKSPEEVVGEREIKPAEEKAAPAKWKVRVDDGSGEPTTREMTLEELSKEGLLDRIITTANQFPSVQKKYTELLERNATGKELPAMAAEAPKKRLPTPVEIRTAYADLLKMTVEGGYMESDFAEAYPDLAHNLIYFRDIIEDMTEKIDHIVAWIGSEVNIRNAVKARKLLDDAIEAVAVKGDGETGNPLYKELRSPEVRKNFGEWICKEVDPKVGAVTVENIEKFWFAFNARGILDFTKETAKKATEPRRKAAGDGPSGARAGTREAPKDKSLLERMSETRLGTEA